MADSAIVTALAEAIAFAEGFYRAGSRPARNNNPGDLTADMPNAPQSVGSDGAFKIFATVDDGWAALKSQVALMLDNASHYYNSSMTIREVAARYTTTDQMAWAQNVASRLGVSLDTKIGDLGTVAEVGGEAGIFLIVVFAFLWFRRKK